jgi:hypothetical protein
LAAAVLDLVRAIPAVHFRVVPRQGQVVDDDVVVLGPADGRLGSFEDERSDLSPLENER